MCPRCSGERIIRTWGGRAGEGGRVGPCPSCQIQAANEFSKRLFYSIWPAGCRWMGESLHGQPSAVRVPPPAIRTRFEHEIADAIADAKCLTPAKQRRNARDAAMGRDFMAGLSIRDIAERCHCTPQTVRNVINRGGLDRPLPPSNASALRAEKAASAAERLERDKAMAADYASGLTLEQVSIKHGVKAHTVRRALTATGAPIRAKGPCQRQTPDPRLPRMVEMRERGCTITEIGVEFKITRERVRQIMARAGYDLSERPLKPEQIAAVEAYVKEGGNLEYWAVQSGVTDSVFRKWVIRCGHVPHPKGNAAKQRVAARAARVAELYAEGKKAIEIAEIVGVPSPEAVYRDLARAGVRPNRLPYMTDRSPQ